VPNLNSIPRWVSFIYVRSGGRGGVACVQEPVLPRGGSLRETYDLPGQSTANQCTTKFAVKDW
jgi:hypothetical protein